MKVEEGGWKNLWLLEFENISIVVENILMLVSLKR